MLEQFHSVENLQALSKKIYVPMNVRFYLKNYLNKEGKSQVYLSISSEGKRDRLPLDIFVRPENWDKTKQRAKVKTENSDTINLILDQAFAKISDIRVHYRLSKMHLSREKLIEEFQNKTPNYDFISFMKYHTDNLILKPNSYRKHQCEIGKLSEYKKFIPFSEITLEFINNYRGYLSKTKKNAPTTIASSIKIILKFLKMAKKYGVFLNVDLSDIKPGSTKSNRINLTIEEVDRLKSYYDSGFIKPHHRLALGYFLFSCYTSLRISDIKKLKREDLGGNTITYLSTKTNHNHTLIINKTAKKILNENEDLFIKWVSDQKINQALKEIASICSIKKKVHFHVARHSFATNFLRKGGKIEDLQTIMDHSDIQTTMVYVHIVKAESMQSMYLMDD